VEVEKLLQRSGLPSELRLLLLLSTSLWPADWELLRECAQRLRAAGTARAAAEEALLQAALFFGFPRTVTAFETLQEAWPAIAPPAGGDVPAEQHQSRGLEVFRAVYGNNDERVRVALRACHSAFHDFVLECAYGRVLARPGLALRERELLAVAALAILQQAPQLVAHGRGALRSGATPVELRETLWTALQDDARADAELRRITARARP
jgi:4-carboxymuconolactone decarboxylase